MSRFARILLFLLVPAALAAQMLPDARLNEAILRGIDETCKEDYAAAGETFRSVIAGYPQYPAGYLYLAATLQAEASDYEMPLNTQELDSLLVRGELLAEKMIDAGKDTDWGYYYAGTALSYRAFSESEEGKWYSAILDGMSSAKMFEHCLAVNPKFTNAMCGLGTYYYWRSRKTDFLTWLPFVSDRRDEGIRLLKAAIGGSAYESMVALSSLMWIEIEESRYPEARALAEQGLARYPGNRSILWGLLTAEERSQDSAGMLRTTRALLASILNAPVRNVYGEITCRLKLAMYAADHGDSAGAIRECRSILRYKGKEGLSRRNCSNKIAGAESLLRRLEGDRTDTK